jgi:hypothetical protein
MEFQEFCRWFLGGGVGCIFCKCFHTLNDASTINSLKYTPLLYICRNLGTKVDDSSKCGFVWTGIMISALVVTLYTWTSFPCTTPTVVLVGTSSHKKIVASFITQPCLSKKPLRTTKNLCITTMQKYQNTHKRCFQNKTQKLY